MTTTKFKVVEFYRNNSVLNKNAPIANNATNNNNSVSSSTTKVNGNGAVEHDVITNGNHSSSATAVANSSLYNILGFEIIGGYLADIPTTIINVASDTTQNHKEVKVRDNYLFL